jgi:para-aminobenzoate synthetase / 4-amino-4-deoxychorismate lyase
MSEASAPSRMTSHRSRRIGASRFPADPALGVFETMLVRDGRPLELGAHLARLGASVAGLYGVPAVPGVEELVLEHARGLRLGRLRVTVAPNGGGNLSAQVRVAAVDDALVFPAFGRAVLLRPRTVEGGLGPHKWADRRMLEAAEDGDSVPLVLDADGSVLEASRANVFVVEDGKILTPEADGRILPGVTRRRVLELLAVREQPIAFDRLLAADEVFLTGSVRGVEPVRACAGERAWPAGTVTELVAGELRRLWEMER